jgi:hypothetical protein
VSKRRRNYSNVAPSFSNITKHNYVVNAGNTNRMQGQTPRGSPLNGVVFGGAPFIRNGKNIFNNPNGTVIKFGGVTRMDSAQYIDGVGTHPG